jgi:hypothetical protein
MCFRDNPRALRGRASRKALARRKALLCPARNGGINGEVIRTHVLSCSTPRSTADALNRESGRLYSRALVEHYRVYRQTGHWLSPAGLEKLVDFYEAQDGQPRSAGWDAGQRQPGGHPARAIRRSHAPQLSTC